MNYLRSQFQSKNRFKILRLVLRNSWFGLIDLVLGLWWFRFMCDEWDSEYSELIIYRSVCLRTRTSMMLQRHSHLTLCSCVNEPVYSAVNITNRIFCGVILTFNIDFDCMPVNRTLISSNEWLIDIKLAVFHSFPSWMNIFLTVKNKIRLK